ncbi:MAG TPA: glycosyltransferase family 39 protein [Actinomycetota bacterium]|nr:glycosyltransferase family 39 protein [Actinomycetota bacterium]
MARATWRRAVLTCIGLLLLAAASAALRIEGLRTWFWIDEAISVGIAARAPAEIPAVLRVDGSPPLYYLLLHAWMGVAGSTDAAVRGLSLALGLMTIPAAFLCARAMFSERVAWVAAVLAAFNPFLGHYSTEARMYTLVALLALVAATTLARACLTDGYLPLVGFALSGTLLLYTHNWGAFLLAGAAGAAVYHLGWRRREPKRLASVGLALAAVAVLYLPWVPSLLHQAAHTGAPWSRRPPPHAMVSVAGFVLGGLEALALVLLAISRPLVRAFSVQERDGVQMRFLLVLVGLTLLTAWSFSQIAPAWAGRYAAVIVGPLVVLAAVVIERGGLRGAAVLVLVLLLWIDPVARITGTGSSFRPDRKSNVKRVARELAPGLRERDLVVSTQIEQVPVLYRYLRPGLTFATPLGRVGDPTVVDWTDASARLSSADWRRTVLPLVAAVPRGGSVVLVCPWPVPDPDELRWFQLMHGWCDRLRDAFDRSPALTPRVGPVPPVAGPRRGTSAYAYLYRRT